MPTLMMSHKKAEIQLWDCIQPLESIGLTECCLQYLKWERFDILLIAVLHLSSDVLFSKKELISFNFEHLVSIPHPQIPLSTSGWGSWTPQSQTAAQMWQACFESLDSVLPSEFVHSQLLLLGPASVVPLAEIHSNLLHPLSCTLSYLFLVCCMHSTSCKISAYFLIIIL